MLDDADLKFIMQLKTYVRQKPQMVSALVEVIQDGITEAFKEASERAADMESVAAMALHAKLFKGNNLFIADRIEKWAGKSSIKWSNTLSKLRKQP